MMDTKTFELYDYDDPLEKLRSESLKNKLVELSHDEYNTLKFMNRADRRKWLRKNKKKLKEVDDE